MAVRPNSNSTDTEEYLLSRYAALNCIVCINNKQSFRWIYKYLEEIEIKTTQQENYIYVRKKPQNPMFANKLCFEDILQKCKILKHLYSQQGFFRYILPCKIMVKNLIGKTEDK